MDISPPSTTSKCIEMNLIYIIDLIYNARHLCTHFRINGIRALSGGISGGKQGIKLANTGNCGQVCLSYQNEMTINSHAKFTARVLTRLI